MQFHWGAVPPARDFVPDETWKPLREPGPWLMQLLAFPIGLAGFITIGFLWCRLTPLDVAALNSPHFLPAAFISFVPLIVLHELIHAAVHPHAGKSDRSLLGFWPSRLLFYAHYDGEMSRARFIAILGMPTVVITVVPLVVAIALKLSHELAAWISTLNVLLACGDMLGIILLFFQVEARAICRNQGWRTYWKSGAQA